MIHVLYFARLKETLGKDAERLELPVETIGQHIGIAGEHPTGEQMAEAMGRALGVPVKYNAESAAAFRAFGFPGAEDLGNMFQFYEEFAEDFCAKRSVAASKALNPALQSLDQWLAANAKRIPLE